MDILKRHQDRVKAAIPFVQLPVIVLTGAIGIHTALERWFQPVTTKLSVTGHEIIDWSENFFEYQQVFLWRDPSSFVSVVQFLPAGACFQASESRILGIQTLKSGVEYRSLMAHGPVDVTDDLLPDRSAGWIQLLPHRTFTHGFTDDSITIQSAADFVCGAKTVTITFPEFTAPALDVSKTGRNM